MNKIKEDKKIIIFGFNEISKLIVYKKILEELLSTKDFIFNVPHINYVDNLIKIRENFYSFINIPSFNFFNNNDNEIKKEINLMNYRIIEESESVIWVIDFVKDSFDYCYKLQSYLEKNKKKYFIIFYNFNHPIEKKEEYLNDHNLQKLLKKDVKWYLLPSWKFDNFKSMLDIILSKEFYFQKNLNNQIIKEKEENDIKLTIFGPPNSGKSTLLNSLIGNQRSVVSSLEGTTKESVISSFFYKNLKISLKDTEGIFKKDKSKLGIFKDCQISLAIIDVSLPIVKKTLQIINFAEKYKRALIIILNKIDLIEKKKAIEKEFEIRSKLKSISYAPIISISAKEKKNFSQLFVKLKELIEQSNFKISKRELSNEINLILKKNPPPLVNGKTLKVYYAIHEFGFTHKFILFVNDDKIIHFSYERYIINMIRNIFNIKHLPIKIFFKKS